MGKSDTENIVRKSKKNKTTEKTLSKKIKKKDLQNKLEKSKTVSIKANLKSSKKNNGNEHEDDEKEIREPTYDEIMESLKPENLLDVETVRQKKKAKHSKITEQLQDNTKHKELHRNIEYLQQWKTERNIWKFKKQRQISIQNHLFVEPPDGMDEEIWPIAVEYLTGTKGSARKVILEKAENTIRLIDEQINGVEDAEAKGNLIKSLKYERAREILQLLQ